MLTLEMDGLQGLCRGWVDGVSEGIQRLDAGVGGEGGGRDMILVHNSTHNKQVSKLYIV